MRENKVTSSIARRINFEFFARQLSIFLALDILILFLLCVCFLYWQEKQLPSGERIVSREFEQYSSPKTIQYVITTDLKNEYVIKLWSYIDFLIQPGLVLLGFELFLLLTGLFRTREIRRLMNPVNEMAKRAEELSNLAFDISRFENLEHAISNIKPDAPDAKVVTGDKELQSLEVAINNLLERMRQTYRQQNRFVSDASHELRTPIAVIQGYVNMLDRWGKEDESILEESIEALKQESQHMKELVEQLLFLARGDSGRNPLKMEKIILSDVVREVCEESMMIDEKHVYRFQGEEEICMYGDFAMIKQSVRIFTDNAAKYSEEGNTILLSVKQLNGEVLYSVQDEGVGMSETEVVHVFERFYRSDGARNSKTGGTGLGLSIAKWIVDAHDGIIEVLSRAEFGTRFTVKFPIKCSHFESGK